MDRISPFAASGLAESSPATALGAQEAKLVVELFRNSRAEGFGWNLEDFGALLSAAAMRCPPGMKVGDFLRGLHLPDLALAQACARGSDPAWAYFFKTFRAPLTQAAIGITKSVSLGEELADSLYAELFGLKDTGGVRKSPLASYSGRGSLMGWLRSSLAQRHVDRFRRTRHETPFGDRDFATAAEASPPVDTAQQRIGPAVTSALRTLQPEDRFLLAAYFLDGRTLLDIARLLRVHEATVSRKLKRLTAAVRSSLLRELRACGMSQRAAEEALATDPRDLTLDLRKILQTSTGPPFFIQQPKPPQQPQPTPLNPRRNE